ncbi:hypothetical protein T265_12055 [Opisthorchis viverrini]|uniref:Uncharacterized protein n=1 Tax=Opisthorchis viverrini TaxID=6198 RepID=A0A074YW61_OPIVI|nr:hypothetical protein T265_12055 [Opisthorchis viverrini]KER19011.1 hypothetical protein T265_12055 [Opisthorchis viverrini]
MRQTVDGFQNFGVQNVAGENFFDVEYADEIIPFSGDEGEANIPQQFNLNQLGEAQRDWSILWFRVEDI